MKPASSLSRFLLPLLLCLVTVTVGGDDTPATASSIRVNGSANGAISPAGDVDYWRFNVPSAGQLVVETAGDTDTIGALEDSAGNLLQEHDDQDVNTNRNFKFERAVTAGVYYIRISAYRNSTGDYTFHVRHTPESGGGAGGGGAGPSGAQFAVSHALGDLNGDGNDDVLLRHTDGRWHYSPMNGPAFLADQRGAAALTRNLDWQFAAIGDLNGDGRDDVLLRRVTDGRWYYYPMNGRQHLADQRGGANIISDLNWQLAGIGDLNGDGRDDVLLRHTDGRWLYYPMDGREYIAGQRATANLTRDLNWQVAGIGDLNGDGNDDVLLRHTDGRWHYYPMNGPAFLADQHGAAALTSNLDWQFAGIGDLNGDGRDDVLLRRVTDGRWYYYPMNGRRHLMDQRGGANIISDLNWQLAGIGDLNNDGRDDVLLRHTDGRWLYYPMNGREYIAGRRATANLTSDPAWSGAGASSGGGSVLVHSIADDCNDGYDMEYRFFEQNSDGSLTGRRVPGAGVYYTDTLGRRYTSRLNCSSSAGYCFGARRKGANDGDYWGIGIDGDGRCPTGETCCYSCPVSGEKTVGNTLLCPADDGGGFREDDGSGEGGDDHSNTRSGATNLSPNSSRTGRIDPGSDTDYFAVQVSNSGTLTVYTTGSLDTTGEMQSSSGSTLVSNDDGGSGRNFRIAWEVSAGAYYIKVESYRTETGSYTLHADFNAEASGSGDDHLADWSDSEWVVIHTSDSTSSTPWFRSKYQQLFKASGNHADIGEVGDVGNCFRQDSILFDCYDNAEFIPFFQIVTPSGDLTLIRARGKYGRDEEDVGAVMGFTDWGYWAVGWSAEAGDTYATLARDEDRTLLQVFDQTDHFAVLYGDIEASERLEYLPSSDDTWHASYTGFMSGIAHNYGGRPVLGRVRIRAEFDRGNWLNSVEISMTSIEGSNFTIADINFPLIDGDCCNKRKENGSTAITLFDLDRRDFFVDGDFTGPAHEAAHGAFSNGEVTGSFGALQSTSVNRPPLQAQ